VSIEDRLGAVLAKQYGEPEAESPAADDEAGPESPHDGSSEESAQVEAQASQEDQPEDDGEEVEYEGATYKVPKELKDALLRQSDYTRKTQDVAKQRQTYEALETALKQEQQFHSAAFDVAAEAKALEGQIKRFDALDWSQLADSDPTEFLKLDRAYRALQQQHASKVQEAQQAYAQAQEAGKQRLQTLAAKAHDELTRDIKGWGKDLQAKLAESGKGYGFSDQELAALIDPRYVKVLHDAHQWRALQAGKTTVQKKVLTAKPVSAPSARTAQSSAQNTKMADARARQKKSGSTADTEALLTLRFANKVK
jgi:hypothetical protein